MRGRKPRYKPKKGIPTEAEIIEGELDTPASLEPLWNIYRLGRKEEHLWMAQLADPITLTTAVATYTYNVDFNFTFYRVTFYHMNADNEESPASITLRVNLINPNGTPSTLWNEVASPWVGGELTLVGARSSPAAKFEIVVSGTAGHLLHVNVEFEVHGLA